MLPLNKNIEESCSKLKDQVRADYNSLICPELNQKLDQKIREFEQSAKNKFATDNPFEVEKGMLLQCERDFRAHGGCRDSILQDLQSNKKFNSGSDMSFWEQKLDKLPEKPEQIATLQTDPLTVLRRNEQEAWRKVYEHKLLEWQLSELDKKRNQLMKELSDWLDKLKQIKDIFDGLGIEPGLLWDASIGNLTQQDLTLLKQWSEYLKDNESIRQLCDLMGRLIREEQSHRIEMIQSVRQYEVTLPDIDSKEEIVGIELGRDLENVVPQELALLSDEDVSLLFDLKYAENRLMCFARQGYQSSLYSEMIEEEVTVAEDDKMGPIIICVDTSGSMSGAPENIAKALTLTLSSRAVVQKRKCYLINFSTKIDTLDLTPPKGISDLLNFLKMSFHGGTDVTPALEEGIRQMTTEEYDKSDLLIISDFVLESIPDQICVAANTQKEKENRFFALSVGNFPLKKMHSIFDGQWTFDPISGNIAALNNIAERICKQRR